MNVALYGGTFDPVHLGHLEVARAAADAFDLDRVLFIPAGRPPHRVAVTEGGYEDRYRMVELACRAGARFEPSRLEAPSGDGQPNYSLSTIQQARSMLGSEDRLFFLLGCDAFAEIDAWYRWQDVVQAIEFIVVSRPGSELGRDRIPAGARVHWRTDVRVPISSTEVRRRLSCGDACEDVLPAAVAAYIQERSLYVRRPAPVGPTTDR